MVFLTRDSEKNVFWCVTPEANMLKLAKDILENSDESSQPVFSVDEVEYVDQKQIFQEMNYQKICLKLRKPNQIHKYCLSAARHFFLSENTDLNVDMAQALLKARSAIKTPTKIYIRINNDARKIYYTRWAEQYNKSAVEIIFIDDCALIIDKFIQHHHILQLFTECINPNTLTVNKDKGFRYLVIGFGGLGQEVLKHLIVDMTGVCLEHGPNPQVSLYATANVLPLWVSSGDKTEIINDECVDLTPLFSADIVDANPLCFSVYKEESSADLRIEGGVTIEKSKICRPAETNIVGAAWTSSHNPIDASDHLPNYEEVEVQFGPNCPVVTDINAKIGFSHDWVNTRNLPVIESSSELDRITDHCVGQIWKPNQVIDLNNFIDLQLQTLQSEYFFVVSGVQLNGSSFATPDKYLQDKESYVYHIELCDKKTRAVLDRLWVIVITRVTRARFEYWYYVNTRQKSWLNYLPKPQSNLNFSRYDLDPEPEYNNSSNQWKKPKEISSWLHHNSQYEMRSYKTTGDHGNQACYNSDGEIITKGIAGGTADYAYAVWWNVFNHVEQDVDPFIWAILIDGNPCSVNIMNEISRPCLYQGSFLEKYLECRPIIQPE